MTPEELDAYLAVVRKHGGTVFKMGDIQVGGLSGPELPMPVALDPAAPPAPRTEKPDPKTPEQRWAAVEEQLWPDGLPT